jgi:hypothetical protein
MVQERIELLSYRIMLLKYERDAASEMHLENQIS